jgi:hypothetical protein
MIPKSLWGIKIPQLVDEDTTEFRYRSFEKLEMEELKIGSVVRD